MKNLIAGCLLILFCINFFFSQDNTSESGSLDEFKVMISEKKSERLKDILQKSQGKPVFSRMSALLIDEIKKIILTENYEQAENYLQILLAVDSENMEAQDIYVNLVKMKKDKQKREEEEIKKKEEKLKKEEVEKKKKQEEEIHGEKANQITNVGIQNFTWNIGFSPAALSYYHSQFYQYYFNEDKTRWLYGVSGILGAYFDHPYIAVGIEGTLLNGLIPFSSDSAKPFYVSVNVMAGSPFILSFPLYLRAGLAYFGYSEFNTTNVLFTSVLSPTLGLGIRKITFLDQKIEIQLHSDVLLAGFVSDNMNFAMITGVSAIYHFYAIGIFHFYTGLNYDHLFLYGRSRWEQAGAIQLQIGAVIK